MIDSLSRQGLLDRGGILIERPSQRSRIRDLDEARPPAKRLTEAPDKRPIAVQPGKIDDGRPRAIVAVNSQSHLFCLRYLRRLHSLYEAGPKPPWLTEH